MGVRISDMTEATSLVGTENIPSSVAGSPRRIQAATIKDFVIDQIEAISAGSTPTGADSVFILQGGDLVPVDIDLVAQHAIDTIWGKVAEASPDGADILALKDGGVTEKTLTLTNLAEFVRSTIEAAVLDISDLADGSGALATTDYMLVTQGTTAAQVTLQDIYDAIYLGLAAHVAGKTDIVSGTGADELYVVRGGTPYKITLTEIATFVNATATLGGSGTADFIATWVDSSTLTAGPSIINSVTGFPSGSGSDVAVPTTQAVRGEMDTIVADATDVGAALQGTDEFLLLDDSESLQRKSDVSRLKTYMETAGTYEELYVDAGAMIGCTTDGAVSGTNEYPTNDIDMDYFAFDGVTLERVQFKLIMPSNWDRGTIKAKFLWTSDAGSTVADTVEWGIKAVALGNDDAIDVAFGTAQVISDALLASGGADVQLSDATPAITVGGTPALGDVVVFEAYRNVGGTDDMTEDAWLLGVHIQYQRNLAVAAW